MYVRLVAVDVIANVWYQSRSNAFLSGHMSLVCLETREWSLLRKTLKYDEIKIKHIRSWWAKLESVLFFSLVFFFLYEIKCGVDGIGTHPSSSAAGRTIKPPITRCAVFNKNDQENGEKWKFGRFHVNNYASAGKVRFLTAYIYIYIGRAILE